MAKFIMENTADESVYLHRDFHEALNNAIGYIGENYGDDGVREYLNDYAESYFRPMSLEGLKDYFTGMYAAEEAPDRLTALLSDGRLDISVSACPGIDYFRSVGHAPCKWYGETTRTLYAALARICGLGFELHGYDEATGKASFSFVEEGKK